MTLFVHVRTQRALRTSATIRILTVILQQLFYDSIFAYTEIVIYVL